MNNKPPFPNPSPPQIKPPDQPGKADYDWENITKDKHLYTNFCKAARKFGFVKEAKDPDAVKRFKIAWFTFLSVVLGDLIIFFGAAIYQGTWDFTPIMYQALILSVLKDLQVVVIGKVIKYLENRNKPAPPGEET